METEEQKRARLARQGYTKEDTLGRMFMDMGKANEWATKVMAPDGKFWTDQIDNFIERKDKTTDELGWSNTEVEVVTIWELTGQNPGKELGKEVFNASLEHGVKSGKKTQSGSEIGYRCYPKAWLEMWFRDYDARLSMEVYNKARAKEALNQINKKSK
jgi:hypothetical protein